MKKTKAAKAKKNYWRTMQKQMQKHLQNHGLPTPSQQAEAKALIEARFADLKAEADKLPALRVENELLNLRTESFDLGVTILAALISPAAFGGDPVDQRAAIELALRRIRDTKRIFDEM